MRLSGLIWLFLLTITRTFGSPLNLSPHLSVSWDLSDDDSSTTLISVAPFRLAFNVCINSSCLEGSLASHRSHSLYLQLCEASMWRNAACDTGALPWPRGVWLTLRMNDDLVELVFLPWCFPHDKECIDGKSIELPRTDEVGLQLFLSDEGLGFVGDASGERLIRMNSSSSVLTPHSHVGAYRRMSMEESIGRIDRMKTRSEYRAESLLSLDAESILSVSWDLFDSETDFVSVAPFRFAFNVCIHSSCLSGSLASYRVHSLYLQLCGASQWRNTTCESRTIPWPRGVWLSLRMNDDLEAVMFLPWCFPHEKDCIDGKSIALPRTDQVALQLFLSDEDLGLIGDASIERLVRMNPSALTSHSQVGPYGLVDSTKHQSESTTEVLPPPDSELLTLDLDSILSVSWDLSDRSTELIAIAPFRLAFNVCVHSSCLAGSLESHHTQFIYLQLCGLSQWSNATCESRALPRPRGVWLSVRMNDDLVELLFLPWCFLHEKNCIDGKAIALPRTDEVGLQLFLSDDELQLIGDASRERLVRINSRPFNASPGVNNHSERTGEEWQRLDRHQARLTRVQLRAAAALAPPSNSCVDSSWELEERKDQRVDGKGLNASAQALSRTKMCNLLEEYPFILNQPVAPHGADMTGPPDPDTLILYAFSQSAGFREDNLFFLLAVGLPSDGRYHVAVVVNGPLDHSWARLFDRVEQRSGGAFEWFRRRDCGRDICAWLSVLDGAQPLRHPLHRFRRFLLLNGSARGPFVPAAFRGPWPELFFSMLGKDVGLAGVTVNCDCDSSQCRQNVDGLHIQSYLLAFAHSAVLAATRSRMRTVCMDISPAEPPKVHMHKVSRAFIQIGEIGLAL